LLALSTISAIACATTTDEPSPPAPLNGASGEASAANRPTWCEARAVLELKCQRCHGTTPEHGAPFSLVTYDDTQAQNANGKLRYELIATALATDFMPPRYLELEPEVALLTDAEQATLLGWCESGAPAPSAEDPDCEGH
jgi:cytochrome c5